MAGDGRSGIRSPYGHDTADPQRTGTHPKQHRRHPRPRITRPRIRRTDAPRFRRSNNPGIRHDFHIHLRANPRPGRKCKTRPGTNAGHRGFLPARNKKPIPRGGGAYSAQKKRVLTNPLHIGTYPVYLESSARAALAFSAAGPSVTCLKAAIACGFISLAL